MSELRILLTGCLGFLGRSIASSLRLHFPEAVLIEQDLGLPGGLGVDLLDSSAVERMVKITRPSVLIHAAGLHGQAPAAAQFSVHAVGTENLLRALTSLGRPIRFLNIGSSSQYGRQDPALEPWLLETHLDRPLSAYAISKQAQELLVSAFAAKGIVVPTFLRLFNPIGPGQTGPFLLPALVAQLRALGPKGGSLHLANADSVRDFVDVRDVAEGVVACMACDQTRGERINLCSGHGTSVVALAELLFETAGVQVELRLDPGPGPGPDLDPGPGRVRVGPPDIPYQRGSPKKLLALAAWKPERDLRSTLSDLWAAGR